MNFHQFLMQSLNGANVNRDDVDLNTQFSPTLLIGLGGTGAQVLLRAKKLILDRLQGEMGLHRFLFVDTDSATFADKPGLPPIEGREKCLVGVRKARAVVKNPDFHTWLWERFPQDELKPPYIRSLSKGDGASQIRSLGAMGVTIDYQDVRSAIEAAHSDLLSLANRVDIQTRGGVEAVAPEVVVFVVGSLAGGTGSGCFLDVAMIAQDVCQRNQTSVVGMFALANNAYDQKVRGDRAQTARMRSNTFAALKELQYVMDAGHSRQEAIVFPYGKRTKLVLGANDTLFDLVYLIDDRNELGALPSVEEVFDLMARTIYQDVGSVLGAARRSFDSNVDTRDTDPCLVTQLPRMFGSVATTSLIYPAERVATYSTLRALEELLREEFLGSEDKIPQIKGSVAGFLANAKLEERGDSNMLLEALLEDQGKSEVMSVSTCGIGRNWGNDLGVRDFASRIGASLTDFENGLLAEAKTLVGKNSDKILGAEESGVGDVFAEQISDYALKIAGERGVVTAAATLADLEDTVEQMTRELEAEYSEWVNQEREAAKFAFHAASDKLRSMKLWNRAVRNKDDALKSLIISQYNNLVENELWAVAKPRAIHILQILKARVAEVKASWVGLKNDLDTLARFLSTTHRGMETHSGATARTFVVVQEVTAPGYEQRYYSGLGRTAADYLADLQSAFALRRGLQVKEAPMKDLMEWMVNAEGGDRVERIGKEFSEGLFASIAPPLLTTNLVTFIKNHPGEVDGSLDKKLDLMYSMCQPFWPASLPTTDQDFSTFTGLTVKMRQVANDNSMVPPAIIKKWADRHGNAGGGDENDTIHTNVPYEIVLSRRTYGARAFYLDPVMAWQVKYDEVQEVSRNKYMTETHSAFFKAPGLLPENNRPQALFALSLAFGFIATRGDWYYFGLERGEDTTRVLFETQSDTVFSLTGTEFPDGAEGLEYVGSKPRSIQAKWKLSQGRENANATLVSKKEWMEVLEEAIDSYHRALGNSKFKKQIKTYRDAVIADRRSKDGDDIYSREYKALTDKMKSIGR